MRCDNLLCFRFSPLVFSRSQVWVRRKPAKYLRSGVQVSGPTLKICAQGNMVLQCPCRSVQATMLDALFSYRLSSFIYSRDGWPIVPRLHLRCQNTPSHSATKHSWQDSLVPTYPPGSIFQEASVSLLSATRFLGPPRGREARS